MSHQAENGKGKITVVEERILTNQVIMMEALEALCFKVGEHHQSRVLNFFAKESRKLLEMSEVTTPRDVIGFR